MRLRVLVVDESLDFRRIAREALLSLPDVDVVGTVGSGRSALQRIEELRPDLVTLEVAMSEMSGVEVIEALRARDVEVAVLVLSAREGGGALTMRALELGALDFVTKPEGGGADEVRERLRAALAPRLRAFARRKEIHDILRSGPPARPPPRSVSAELRPIGLGQPGVAQRRERVEVVLIGVSTGGPVALAQVLPLLPGDLGVPVLVVQHIPAVFSQTLAASLSPKCVLRVKEAEDGERALPNVIYLAPGGRQMGVSRDGEQRICLRITDDPPENNCRPSVDHLFRSVAQHLPGRACAVIMTGMGNDGTAGLRLLRRAGCQVIAQDEASCVVFGMPKSAIEAGLVDAVLPLSSIARGICCLAKGGPR